MNSPLVYLPDNKLTHPFEKYSMTYWEAVREIMRLTGALREDTERFICAQRACVS